MAHKKTETTTKTLVLLDAHAILHRAYHALPDFTAPNGEPTGALYGVVTMLLKIVEELKPDYIVACYDLPEPTYRHEVYKEYKAGRAKTDDVLIAQINRSRDIFQAFGIPIYAHPGFEADDILGTIVTQTRDYSDLRVIIASGDMDTLQLIEGSKVLVYTLKKGINDTVLYDEKGVYGRFGFGPTQIPDYKGLRGDPSDNIPGIKGIGEKIATELLLQFKTVEGIYKALKKDPQSLRVVGIKDRIITLLSTNEEEALFSKMLATIRRDAPIQFTLPTQTWREGLVLDTVLGLFAELGFRALVHRVQTLFGEGVSTTVSTHNVDPEKITAIAIALWLLNSDITNPSYDDIMQYGRMHNLSTFEGISEHILDRLITEGLNTLYRDVELPLRNVLTTMERHGIRINVSHLNTLSIQIHEELSILEKRIHSYVNEAFNINSPKQLGVVLYDTLGLKPKNQKHTATGQRSTKESELEKLIDAHPIIPDILRYREIQKLVSTYIDTIPAMVASDGRLHTTFLQAGTTTGRMSSQNPNIQNIPVRTKEGRGIRAAFVADTGYTLVSIDYSQMELRVAAFLSGDTRMSEIFKNGEDVHQGVAMRVFGVEKDEVTSEMRRKAKVINFGILYGMGVNALKANLGEDTTRTEAQLFYTAYFNTFTRLAEYLEETKAYARAHGYTQTFFGRRRHFQGIHSSAPFIRAQTERMAINAPVQGTSADIIRIAMVRIRERSLKEGWGDSVRMLLQVHDELVFEIKNDMLSVVVPVLKECMETVLSLEDTAGVPLLVEVKEGANWDVMESKKYD